MKANNGQLINTVDFNLHDFVGLRLYNAQTSDVATVVRQLGPIQGSFVGEPDIVIRFENQLPDKVPIRYLGLNDAAFTDNDFLVLRSKHKTPAKVQIPFDQIGKQCEIVCERGLPAVPLLIEIVNLTVLSKGVLPLHASAFVYNDKGVLVTGWAKGGKTETLLSFMRHGATYVADEWTYLTGDGSRMYGIPEPIRIWDWHLDEMPEYRAQLSPRKRFRLRALKAIADTMEVASDGPSGRLLPSDVMRRVQPLLRKQLYVHMPPHETFGETSYALQAPLDKVFFVGSHELTEITVEPADPEEVARRMLFSLQEERLNFLSYYWKFRFAFPERENALIENLEQLQLDLLLRILAGKELHVVYHPYPVSFPALYEAIAPYCT